jgi:hypothetical protein
VHSLPRIVAAGLLGGFLGNGVLGALFSSSPVRRILHDPAIQSRLFIEVTPARNIPLSVGGLVVLSVIHAWLYTVFCPSIPGHTWVRKGLFWGLTIWLMFWLFQEWFVYHTLLGEPWYLNLLELFLLLIGSFVEGVIIAGMLRERSQEPRSGH